MTAEHADFEALSAFVDGEAPEWAEHVAGCPRCRATAAELRALSARVAAPADPPPAAQREAAIAAALGAAFDGGAGATDTRPVEPAVAAGHEAQRARFGRFTPGSWAMPAIAAVVLACLGLAGVILSSTRSTDQETTVAGPAFDVSRESAVPGAPAAPVGDLGEVPDAATLRARALAVGAASPAGASASAGRSSSSSNSGAISDAQSSATNTTGGAGGTGGSATLFAPPNAAAVTPNVVGTRPCEERARDREPGLGPVTYFATARGGGVPAYVLGFASPAGQLTLLMLAQDGCAELLRSAGP